MTAQKWLQIEMEETTNFIVKTGAGYLPFMVPAACASTRRRKRCSFHVRLAWVRSSPQYKKHAFTTFHYYDI